MMRPNITKDQLADYQQVDPNTITSFKIGLATDHLYIVEINYVECYPEQFLISHAEYRKAMISYFRKTNLNKLV